MASPRPRGWEGKGRVAKADRSTMATSTVLLLHPAEQKPPSLPGAQRLPQLMDFSTEQPPGPGKVCQKCLSRVEDYKRKCVNGWRQPSAPCRKKSEQSSYPPLGGRPVLHWGMKGCTGLVIWWHQPLWRLLTSSHCLSFQSTISQTGQRKEKRYNKASISTLRDFKIMSVSFLPIIRTDLSQWKLSLKV